MLENGSYQRKKEKLDSQKDCWQIIHNIFELNKFSPLCWVPHVSEVTSPRNKKFKVHIYKMNPKPIILGFWVKSGVHLVYKTSLMHAQTQGQVMA